MQLTVSEAGVLVILPMELLMVRWTCSPRSYLQLEPKNSFRSRLAQWCCCRLPCKVDSYSSGWLEPRRDYQQPVWSHSS